MSLLIGIEELSVQIELDRLKEEILNLLGVRKLVSGDDDYLMSLAFAETIKNLE